MKKKKWKRKNYRNSLTEHILTAVLIVIGCLAGGAVTAGTAVGTLSEQAGTETVTEMVTGAVSEVVVETEIAVETALPSEKETFTGTEAVTECQPVTETERLTEAETFTGTEMVTECQPATETERLTEPETFTGTETVTEYQPVTETEFKPELESVSRGIHYEVTGDAGAYWWDENDRFWVRSGTGIHIRPLPQSGYNQGISQTGLETDGSLDFVLRNADENGTVVRESGPAVESYYVDGEAPGAVIQVDGEESGGMIYIKEEAKVCLLIEPDAKSGLKRAAYCVIPCADNGTWLSRPDECTWIACGNGSIVSVKEEGTFQIYVRTEDQVGNLAFASSIPFCVDRTLPEISVEGVQNRTANSGEVSLCIACEDENYREGSLNVSVTGMNQGKMPIQKQRQEHEDGAYVQYYDFPAEKAYDDMYRMQVSAEDKAGNRTEKLLEFSVNRFGSVYDLSDETRAQLSRYYLSAPADIVFSETNIDYVGESKIFCRCDGELQILEAGKDYLVSMQGDVHTWKQYSYTVPADYFRQEGVYELLLTSGDRAANVSDTGIQEKRVVFVLDSTAPSCTLSGIERGMVSETDLMTAYVTPHDNTGVETVRVYCNSILILEKRENVKVNETISISIDESDSWQILQVYVRDFAGNEFWSEEIPVYVSENQKEVPEYPKTGTELVDQQERTQSETDEQAEPLEIPVGNDGGVGTKKRQERVRDHQAGGLVWPVGTAVLMLITAGYMLIGSRRKH